MIRKLIIPAFIAVVLCTSSCETDFDITAPYKDIPVIYGLLNISDSIQWVRIQKVFLGEGDAYVMAQNPDSINYPDILDVSFEEYSGNTFLRKINLIRDESIPKEEGIFATTPNVLYRTSTSDKIVGKNSYKLVVHNLKTDSIITAVTPVVDSIFIINPLATSTSGINFAGPNPFTATWTVVPEGEIYQLVIRFHYTEAPVTDPTAVVFKYIDWKFPEQEKFQEQNMNKIIEFPAFYQFVAGSISQDNSVIRNADKLDFIITSGAIEFYTYILVNKPSTGINQNINQYTNINGGYGIFSSRIIQEVKDKKLNTASLDSLNNGSITGHLGFQ
ncbi:MAG: hypothetical protein ACHQNT_11995 [Bacteroidia bacterium]